MKILATYQRPPIPTSAFDWCAVDDDTYDDEGSPIGWGSTPEAAIADLQEQIQSSTD